MADLLTGGSARPPRRRATVLVVLCLVAAGAGYLAVRGSGSSRQADGPTTTPTSTPPSAVTDVGHRLLGVRGSWELVGRGSDTVVRVEPAKGKIVRTQFPGLDSSEPVSFLVDPHSVIIRPLDRVTGYVVHDGQPARELAGGPAQSGPVLPGPDPAHLWLPSGSDTHPAMALVDLTGRPTGVSIPIPTGVIPQSDGAGYLLFTKPDGSYDARPHQLRRITTRTVIAAGPTRWVTRACTGRQRCAAVVVDRASGARHLLGAFTGSADAPIGAVSADGDSAAVFRADSAGHTVLQLLSLTTGTARRLPVSTDPDSFGNEILAWSPDSRWLFVAGAGANSSSSTPAPATLAASASRCRRSASSPSVTRATSPTRPADRAVAP